MQTFVGVTNKLANTVTVAYATIPPGQSKDVEEKALKKWFEQGGKRLVENGDVEFHAPGKQPVVAIASPAKVEVLAADPEPPVAPKVEVLAPIESEPLSTTLPPAMPQLDTPPAADASKPAEPPAMPQLDDAPATEEGGKGGKGGKKK